MRTHGTAATYGAGCRCVPCRGANTEYARAARTARKARLASGRARVQHGTSATYCNWGCRCHACTVAHRVVRLQLLHAKRDREAAS